MVEYWAMRMHLLHLSRMISALFFLAIGFGLRAETISVEKILSLDIHATINPATLNYLESGFKRASREGADLLLIKLSTPGGLVTTTKDILSLFGTSDIPVAIWVTPEGSSATSAGAILAGGAHVLVMSEGTNMGAATPVSIQGEVENGDARSKAVNDLVALVQSLAETRGRNAELFGEMVAEGSSFKARGAQESNLIDGIVNTEREFFNFLKGRTIHLKGQDYTLELPTETPEVVRYEMDTGQTLLNILANPSLAYILFLIGAALIYLEFQAAGGFVAGAIGALCIVLAGIGFQVLPLNFGALGLIVLSFVLFIVEAFVTSFGLLTLAGITSLIFGSLFLYRTEDSYLSLSTAVIFGATGSVVAFLGIILYIMVRERKKIGAVRFNDPTGKKARVIGFLEEESDGQSFCYQVQVEGELWKAISRAPRREGEICKVKAQEGLFLEL